MDDFTTDRLDASLAELRANGLYKHERVLEGPQGAHVRTNGVELINLCSNNYLGLANHAAVVQAAHEAVDRYGYGMASVRFICGTQAPHRALEERLSEFLGMEDTILFPSCFDANGGLFETLLDERDAVISDSLNHASIIDGIRLSKATRHRYENSDLADLERCLQESSASRTRLITTDGVFSMDGTIAKLAGICDLADRYDALDPEGNAARVVAARAFHDRGCTVGNLGDSYRATPNLCRCIWQSADCHGRDANHKCRTETNQAWQIEIGW